MVGAFAACGLGNFNAPRPQRRKAPRYLSKERPLRAIVAMIVATALLVPVQSQAQNETDKVMKAIAPQRRELLACWANTAALYASKTCESADMVVRAAFGKWAPEERRAREALLVQVPKLGSMVDAVIDGFRDGGWPIMLSAIFDKRVQLGHCAATTPN